MQPLCFIPIFLIYKFEILSFWLVIFLVSPSFGVIEYTSSHNVSNSVIPRTILLVISFLYHMIDFRAEARLVFHHLR